MAEAKIQFKVGAVEFSGEGDKDWLEKQVELILLKAQTLPATNAALSENSGGGAGKGEDKLNDVQISQKSLASFLKDNTATTNQNKKFLVTAIWLHAKGSKRIRTGDVTKALKDNSQNKLTNPADCLNQNVKKGFCEKDSKEFFVTDEGKNSL